MATVYFSGYVFKDNGDAVSGATVSLLEAGTTTEEASTTTDSNGFWSFNETDDDKYDVKITQGSQIRYRKWADEIQVKALDVRNNEGEGVPAATFTNFADGDDMEIVHYRGLRGTGAADDNLFFRYYMDDASGNITEMANMAVNLVDASASSEDVKIIWQIKAGASMVDALTISSTSGAVVSTTFNQNALTFGTGADTDISLTFNANSYDGVITWMEDEDYFAFSDEILMNTTEKIHLRDTAIYINSSADGQLDLVADTEIQIAATTIDINGTVALDGAITGATNITLSGELDAATLDISGNADIDGTTNLDAVDIDGAVQIDATFTSGVDGQGYDTTFYGDTSGAYILWDTSADKLLTAGGAVVDIVKDKLLIGGTAVTTTAAELNVLDAVTAGTVSASLGVVVDSNKDIGSFRNITLTGELDAGSLDVSGNADIDGTLETDALTVGGTNVLTGSIITTLGTISAGVWNGTAITGAYINDDIISGQTEITSGLAAADELLYSDGGTVKKIGLDNLVELGPALSTEDAIANGDYILFLDGGASGNMNKEAVHDLATLFAGSGLTATNSVIAVDTLNQDTSGTAAIATTVTITDNESTDEDNAIIFTSGGDVDGGNIGLESDGTLTYNPSTGKITATGFLGAIDGILGANSAAAITGTTIDANTDFTVGDTVITDGTITDTSGLTIAAAVDLGSNTLTSTGSMQIRTIDYSDGDLAVTIADGGGVTFAQDVALADDKSITLGDEGQIIFSDVAPSTDHSATGIVIKGTLASGVTAGMALYLQADGEYDHADKDTEGHMPAVGVALEAAGDDRKILIYGVYVDASLSLTRGEELYVGDDGAVTHTVPGSGDFLQRVGVALTTTSVLFMPSLDVIEHA